MIKKPKKNLGKGLSALLGTSPALAPIDKQATSDGHAAISDRKTPIEKIYPGSFQPRQNFSSPELSELSDSIKA